MFNYILKPQSSVINFLFNLNCKRSWSNGIAKYISQRTQEILRINVKNHVPQINCEYTDA